MRLLMIIIFSMICLSAQSTYQELIIAGHSDIYEAKLQLKELNKYIKNNSELLKIKKKYQLHGQIRQLGEYHVVTLGPIDTLSLRNRLLLLLHPSFPETFYINKKASSIKLVNKDAQKHPKGPLGKIERKERDIIDAMGLQWFAILMLSLMGLILSVYRRNRVRYLQKIQKILGKKQNKMETKIREMERTHA